MELPLSTFQIYLLGCTILVFLIHYAIGWVSKVHKNYPPGPKGLWILGYIPFMGPHPDQVMSDLAEKYGDVVMFRAGIHNIVILNSVEATRECFVKQGDNFTATVPGFRLLNFGMNNLGVFAEDGDMWKEQRKFMISSMRDLGVGKMSLEDRVLEECDAMVEEIEKLKGKPFYLTPLLGNVVVNIIFSVVFGTRYKHDDPEFAEWVKLLEAADITFSNNLVVDYFPLLHKLPGRITGLDAAYKLRAEMMKHIDKKLAELHRTFHTQQINCLVDCYFHEMEKRKANGEKLQPFDYCRLQSNMIAILIAATVTTAMTLTWAIMLLLTHPSITKKILKQLDDVIGNERRPSWYDRLKLPLVEATVHEAQRFADIVPIGVPHACKDDCKVMNYDIPKNSVVYGNLRKLHNDPKLWGDPETFRPERFINPDGQCIKPDFLLPFGVGKRMCLGENLARMNMYHILITILQNFTLEGDLNAKDFNDRDNQTAGIIRYLKPIHISLKKRKP